MILWGSKETTTIISPRISFYFQSKDHILSVIQILFPIYIFSNIRCIFPILWIFVSKIKLCFQMAMFPIYMDPYFSVVWLWVNRSYFWRWSKFLIVPNANVAKFWCSSIGRTKRSTCRYWISSMLTRTQNRPFFKLWPRHFLGRIFGKKLYHVTY